MDNLQKLIKLYAFIISEQIDLGFRIPIHKQICLYLNLDRNAFKPFESEHIKEVPSYQKAIMIIQREINRLKGYDYSSTKYDFYNT